MALNSAVKKITKIEAMPIQKMNGLPEGAKKRVCAYCRVSTELEEQESSFTSQVNFYTQYISSRVD